MRRRSEAGFAAALAFLGLGCGDALTPEPQPQRSANPNDELRRPAEPAQVLGERVFAAPVKAHIAHERPPRVATQAARRSSQPGLSFAPSPRLEREPARRTPCAGTGATSNSFEDVSVCAGIAATHASDPSTVNTSMGTAFGDYDNDGWIDLYVTTEMGSNVLYRNVGGRFEISDLSEDVELPDGGSSGAIFADYDNDGWKDLYVLTLGRNRLFRNVEGRGFRERSAFAGVDDPGNGSTGSFGDYDNDGYLDLYVANWFSSGQDLGRFPDRLYHNEGDGTFTDVSVLLDQTSGTPGPTRTGAGFIATFADFNNDGWPDLYLANDKGSAGRPVGLTANRNMLWENRGPGCGGHCFMEVGEALGADIRGDAMGIAVGDYDNDGDLDFSVSDTGRIHVLENDAGHRFVEVSNSVGAIMPVGAVGWGLFFFDFDNDAWADLFVAAELDQNSLFRNRGRGSFNRVTSGSGLDDPYQTLGAAYADFDRDGHVDVLIGNRGRGYRLLRNAGRDGAGRHWVSLRLVGNRPVNRDAIGARAYVQTTDGLTLMQEVKAGSSLGAGNELALHFGLGAADIEHVRIVWPDGTQHMLQNVPRDASWRIVYPESTAPASQFGPEQLEALERSAPTHLRP